ncbi:glycosyltransferase family 2 protein [Flavobacterium alvei]|uniref:Glycosyltransferase family 2 protein n=1 Tax=Flavobacterium alvei TaxID=2080416 RepID=A0A2S5AG03_9FLAO|nr:glycosyltransferase family 2 protein [Flavobacterium alvei]POY41219.1 glycosyltransferase family 2 protein [Flavobacterium alvei]
MLAIVIPYHKLTFFEETLQSLENQTDKRFKVYIGDDASLENPVNLLDQYQGKFDFVYQRFESNVGGISLTQQWERCIALSGEEEWIMILGDDDYLGENVVQQFYNQLPEFQYKSNVVRFASQLVYEIDHSKSKIYTNPVWESATAAFYRKFMRVAMSSLSEYVFSRKAYEKHGFYNYPLAWNSDDQAWLDFSEDKPIYSINESIVYPRMSAENITGKRDNWKLKNESSAAFYHTLIQKQLKQFTRYESIKIIRKYYFELKKVKCLEIKDWIFLIKHYVANWNVQAVQDYFKKNNYKKR